MNTKDNIIVCKDLNKYYSGVHALKDLSLDIKKDSVVGLIGDNGAGKSTLVNIISGVFHLDKGEYRVNDKLARFANPREAIDAGIPTATTLFPIGPDLTSIKPQVKGITATVIHPVIEGATWQADAVWWQFVGLLKSAQ